MPSFRVEQPRTAPFTANEDLHLSSSLVSSLSGLRVDAEEFVPASPRSEDVNASDVLGGLGSVRIGHLQHPPSSHSLEGQVQTSDKWDRRVDLVIKAYLLENSEDFRRLNELRQSGWENPAGDTYFKNQRQQADNADKKVARVFYNMMQQIAQEMHQMTGGALAIAKRATGDAAILDTCMAPGGFLNTAMKINPGASALGMSLPVDAGGHKVLAPKGLNVSCRFVDINMLAADIGVSSIPPDHPDAENFLPRQIDPAAMFDLAICDGQVLRPHTRAPYRERREAIRLTLAQLILSLEHLRPGGTMIVLLHRVERPKCLGLLYTFSKFSSVQLFKPKKYHATRSSFYMIVTDVQSQHLEAQSAVAAWKKQWNAATFGTDEEVEEAIRAEFFDVDKVLQDFGPELLRMGRAVWVTQAQALSKKSWTRKQTKNQDTGDRTMLE